MNFMSQAVATTCKWEASCRTAATNFEREDDKKVKFRDGIYQWPENLDIEYLHKQKSICKYVSEMDYSTVYSSRCIPYIFKK